MNGGLKMPVIMKIAYIGPWYKHFCYSAALAQYPVIVQKIHLELFSQ